MCKRPPPPWPLGTTPAAGVSPDGRHEGVQRSAVKWFRETAGLCPFFAVTRRDEPRNLPASSEIRLPLDSVHGSLTLEAGEKLPHRDLEALGDHLDVLETHVALS